VAQQDQGQRKEAVAMCGEGVNVSVRGGFGKKEGESKGNAGSTRTEGFGKPRSARGSEQRGNERIFWALSDEGA